MIVETLESNQVSIPERWDADWLQNIVNIWNKNHPSQVKAREDLPIVGPLSLGRILGFSRAATVWNAIKTSSDIRVQLFYDILVDANRPLSFSDPEWDTGKAYLLSQNVLTQNDINVINAATLRPKTLGEAFGGSRYIRLQNLIRELVEKKNWMEP